MAYSSHCEICDKDFQYPWPNVKTCSPQCQKERNNKRQGRYADKTISGGTTGAISELIISADLMKKGYAVFRSLSPACFCDLIAIKKEIILKIDVKTGYKGTAGNISFPNNNKNEIDLYGVYIRSHDEIFYFNKGRVEVII